MTTFPGHSPEASTSAIVSSATRRCSSSSRRWPTDSWCRCRCPAGSRRRVVDLEEELEQSRTRSARGRTRSRSPRRACRGCGRSRSAHRRRCTRPVSRSRRVAPEQILHAPEAAARQESSSRVLRSRRAPSSRKSLDGHCSHRSSGDGAKIWTWNGSDPGVSCARGAGGSPARLRRPRVISGQRPSRDRRAGAAR